MDKEQIEKKIKEKDRRVKRSLKLLKQGLLELMAQKSFPDISVKDITDRMDMNRGTFYLHYSDTSELLKSVTDDLIAEATELIESHRKEFMDAASIRPIFEPILDFIVENKGACAMLYAYNEASGFTAKLQGMFQKYGVEILESRYHNNNETAYKYLSNFVAYGLMSMVELWFSDGMRMSQEELFFLADRFMTGAADGYINAR